MDETRKQLDGPLRKAVQMAAHELAVEISDRYRVVTPGCLPLDEEAIAARIYSHIRASGYIEPKTSFNFNRAR